MAPARHFLITHSYHEKNPTQTKTLVCFVDERALSSDVWEADCDTALTHPLLISLLKQSQPYELLQLTHLEALSQLLSTVIFTFKWAKQGPGT